MIKRLIEHPRFEEFDLSSFHLMLYGAAPIDAALLAQAMADAARRELLPGLRHDRTRAHHLGAAARTTIVRDRTRPKRLRSAGRPVPIAEVRIVDNEDRTCRPARWARSPRAGRW